MNKDREWLKESINDLPNKDVLFEYDDGYSIETAVPLLSVYDLVDELGNLGKDIPAIPRVVADFLEEYEDWRLIELFNEEHLYKHYYEVADWLYGVDFETSKSREVDLVKAHVNGYEIEQNKKYFAKIKGWYMFADLVGVKYWGATGKSGRIGFVGRMDAARRTIEEWESLGIDKSNADFEE